MLEPAQEVRYLKSHIRDSDMQGEMLEGGGFIRKQTRSEKKKISGIQQPQSLHDEPKTKKKTQAKVAGGAGRPAGKPTDAGKNYLDIHKSRISKMFQPLTLSRRNSPKPSLKKPGLANVFMLHNKEQKRYCDNMGSFKVLASSMPKKIGKPLPGAKLMGKASKVQFGVGETPQSMGKGGVGGSIEKSHHSRGQHSINNSKSIGLTFRTVSSRHEEDWGGERERGESYAQRLRSSSLLQRAALKQKEDKARGESINRIEAREVRSNLPSARGTRDQIVLRSCVDVRREDQKGQFLGEGGNKEVVDAFKSWYRGYSQDKEKSRYSDSIKQRKKTNLSGKIIIPQMSKDPKVSVNIGKKIANCFASNKTNQRLAKRKIESLQQTPPQPPLSAFHPQIPNTKERNVKVIGSSTKSGKKQQSVMR